MRRVLAMAAAAGVLATGAAALAGAGDDDAGGARVDAIFRNAGFLIPGQDVKIGGARVGQVKDVALTAGRRARIQMEIDPRFAPFRRDAECAIQPQSLIGEKFIQCDPGTARAGELEGKGDAPPTIGLGGTSSPIDLDLVLATLRQPTTTRAALLVSALGGGLAGRADDLEATVRQADPAFRQVERLLTLVNEDRRTIQDLIAQSDTVVSTLARRREDVADFVSSAADVSGVTARRQAELRETLDRLPALLDEARPGLTELRRLAQDGTPIVREVGKAAPAADRLVDALGPFARQATPTLAELEDTARAGRRAVAPVRPQVRRLSAFAKAMRPAGANMADLFQSMATSGAAEGLLKFVHLTASATARYDSVSHILPAYLMATDTCNVWASTTVESCAAHFATGGSKARAKAPERDGGERKKAGPQRDAAPRPAAPRPQGAPAAPKPVVPQALDGVDEAVRELPEQLKKTLEGLLGGGAGAGGTGSGAGGRGSQDGVTGLLDLLLGP